MNYMEIDVKKLFSSLLMLTRGFGIDLSIKFQKTSMVLTNKIGFQKAHKILIAISLDEIFIFVIYKLFTKAAHSLKLEHFLKVEQHIGQIIIPELMTLYCQDTKEEESKEEIFNSKYFKKFYIERFSEYLNLYFIQQDYPTLYFLQLMQYSIKNLKYYKRDGLTMKDGKIQREFLDDIKWLEEQIEDLIKDIFE